LPAEPASSLAEARSPFLRHAATQPVNWFPWGDAAFDAARREGRPILLDIGAVWCHWCHVMDRESYQDPETARLINENFIAVKVDRDERPDVDARYQRAVQLMTGQGGWPLTAFLTPDGEAFFGGTYFPPEERHGRPSFRRVLAEVARIWREDRKRAADAVRELRAALQQLDGAEARAGAVSPELVGHAVHAFLDAFDEAHGGFGGAPKFPNATALTLLLEHHLDTGDARALDAVRRTLDAMARGGIHDQLGGGFHRYSTDARWLVPHFEKMAYDNGVLLELYARAFAVAGDPLWRAAAEGILAYYDDVAPGLLARGGFPASQDADIGPDDDGDYWTWTRAEVERALGGDERLIRAAVLGFGLDDPGARMHLGPERRVLFRALPPEELGRRLETGAEEAAALLAEAARRLKAARDERPRPFVDETVYTGWSCLLASGCLAAARHLGRDDARDTALRCLARIWDEAFDATNGAAHRLDDPDAGAFLEDQADFAQALVDAFEATQDDVWLARARAVADVLIDRFSDADGAAFVDRPADEPAPAAPLAAPHRPIADAPAPAGNAVAALVLLRLAALTGVERYRERAGLALAAFADSAPRMITAAASYARAVGWATAPLTSVVVIAEPGDAAGETLFRAALGTYRPRTVLRRFAPGRVDADAVPPELRAMLTGAAPRAYVCAGQSCAAPVAEPDALRALLRDFRG